MPETPKFEKVLNRGTADLLNQERYLMEDALAQANFMNPELYALLGYEPIYDQAGPDIGALSQKSRAINDELNQIISAIQSANARKGKKGKKEVAAAAGYKNLDALKRRRVELLGLKSVADRELGEAQTIGRRVIGLKKLDRPGDPTGSKDDLFAQTLDLQNQELRAALMGEAPTNATLAKEYEEREKTLRERLRRQLGPDYETSTAGSEALANFDREKAEAFEQYRQGVIRDFSGLTESRAAALSDLTGKRMEQLLFPSNAQSQRALLLGQVASDRNKFVASQREGRSLEFEGSKAKYQAEAANDAARAQAIAGIGQSLSSVGQGLVGFGTSQGNIGRYLGSG